MSKLYEGRGSTREKEGGSGEGDWLIVLKGKNGGQILPAFLEESTLTLKAGGGWKHRTIYRYQLPIDNSSTGSIVQYHRYSFRRRY
jgi:hypothetical protein